MTESTLVSFRRVIAAHLAKVLGVLSVENLFPLVQQNINHRKASHSVFFVVIKRLQNALKEGGQRGGGYSELDEATLNKCCANLSEETQQWILQVRLTKDMLLFDPQPLQMIHLAVEAIYREYGGEGRSAGEEHGVNDDGGSKEEGVLGKREREEEYSENNQQKREKQVVIVDGIKTLQDENAFCSLRRVVLTGFIARLLEVELDKSSLFSSLKSVKVLVDPGNEKFLNGLDVAAPIASDLVNEHIGSSDNNASDKYLEIIQQTLIHDPLVKALISTKNGSCTIDLSSHHLGQVRLFSSSAITPKEDLHENDGTNKDITTNCYKMSHPTVIVETIVSMAYRFEQYGTIEGDEDKVNVRYIWIVPDGRRRFAEQALLLARMFFPGGKSRRTQKSYDVSDDKESSGPEPNEHEEPVNKKRIGPDAEIVSTSSVSKSTQKSWADLVEVVYYGPVSSTDLLKEPFLSTEAGTTKEDDDGEDKRLGEMKHVIEYTNTKMREVVEANRGGGGAGGYSGAYGDGYEDDDNDEGCGGGEESQKSGMDEAELERMSKILSWSALVISCCAGKRIKKLNVSLARIVDGKGNSGVFLQYVLSRLYGIERKSRTRLNPRASLSHIASYQESFDLSLLLAEWPEILSSVQESLDPSALVSYLFNLAAMVGQANRVLRVKGMETEVAEARWLVFWAAKRIFEEGLKMLGLEYIERM
ncbi:Arginyl-tRNA synthetase [Linnemannia zychae]|nr:Arginyl-tRNA synthetase [Linnemannia zychae]